MGPFQTHCNDRRYVRVTVSLDGRKRTVWALKCNTSVGFNMYLVVDKEGDHNPSGKVEYIVCLASDVVSEKMARMNLHYGELELGD